VPDREDTAMERVEPAEGDAMVDRAFAEAGRRQLGAPDDAVLPPRERGDHLVVRSR
jgi:hypothetical protein